MSGVDRMMVTARTQALLVCVLCACSAGSGVDIRIAPDPDIRRVELFVAPEACTPGQDGIESCDPVGLSWAAEVPKQPGDIYVLDIAQATVADALADGSFRVALQAGSETKARIARLLLVGYSDDAGTQPRAAAGLVDVEIPTSGAEEWRVTLRPTELVEPGSSLVNGDRIRVWNRSSDSLSKCIVGERWKNGQVTREFLVPAADTDCDDVPTSSECDPYWAHAMTSTSTTPACAGTGRLDGLSSVAVCQVGATACSEEPPYVDGCGPLPVPTCTNTAMCANDCWGGQLGCIEQGTLPTLKCYAPTQNGLPCTNDAKLVVSFVELVEGTGATCGVPSLSPLSPTPTFLPDATLGSIVLANGNTGAGCSRIYTWSRIPNLPPGVPPAIEHGLVRVPLSNGREVVFALSVDMFTYECSGMQIPPCTFIGLQNTDDLLACARP